MTDKPNPYEPSALSMKRAEDFLCREETTHPSLHEITNLAREFDLADKADAEDRHRNMLVKGVLLSKKPRKEKKGE